MTEPKKPRATKPKAAKPRVSKRKISPKTSVPATPSRTVLGQTITDETSVRRQKYGDDIKAAARAMWQGDPNITKQQVAAELGIPYPTVDRWSKGDEGRGNPWAKVAADMSPKAHAAADKYRVKLAELGPEITTDQRIQTEADAAEQTAVEMRAQVLDRHRKEWNAPRKISYEAVTERNFEKAKLAKITAETLKLVQDGERKAWGIDTGPDGSRPVTVVIERD
jgi:hypothetical protein